MGKRTSSHNELIKSSIEIYSKSIETISEDKAKLAIINDILDKIIDDKIKDKVGNIIEIIGISTIEFSPLDNLFSKFKIDEFEAKDDEVSPKYIGRGL